MFMRVAALAGLLSLAACQKSDLKVLIGGTAVVAPGAAPIVDSVIVISGQTIRSVGLRKDIPIPQDSERTDLSGNWVLPVGDGRIAPNEPANLRVTADGKPGSEIRRLTNGEWVK